MKLLVDGQEAYAYTGGKPFDPALPCVVFIHGALNDHSVWTLLARWCAHHGYGVLAVDLPGHGRSAGAPLKSVEDIAAWLHRLLDAAGVQKAALVGHSMGSLIALEAAERASTLVMVGTAYPMMVSEALLTTARDRPEAAMAMVTAFSHSLASAKPSYPGPGAWLRGGSMALMRRLQSRQTAVNLFENDFQVCDRYAGGEAAAARVSCPVHFILGTLDQMTSPKQNAVLGGLLKPRMHRLSAGHALMAEAPDAMLAALKTALQPNS
ncbi:pimeloyl-ACP methyl ester carboxylesterase [Pelomonas saccharophila]|uniref:Pimeloyl-ACP methyl ester carboxylesterase n=1 Tax=Roseateles saccharophilus TaxID=304 RepID=A0ABU1YT11_ROSSA|nr:alpha/beta hydrolase [Roseateles saccharophilus]MDR7271987.1 pimeloyl-ACP methyl ester carboxylesterase [Roseateles saccharophilus]